MMRSILIKPLVFMAACTPNGDNGDDHYMAVMVMIITPQ
jgi:hypothetical protein